MRIYPECIPCFFRQGLITASKATDDREKLIEVMLLIAEKLPELVELPTPTHAGKFIHSIPRKMWGIHDPYKQDKERFIKMMLDIYPRIKVWVGDNLQRALKVAASGNAIDFATLDENRIMAELQDIGEREFKRMEYDRFVEELENSKMLLYLADNAGETVFDKLLIEVLKLHYPQIEILYAVRGYPTINDAVYEDAVASGIDEVAKIIDSGCEAPGIILEDCNEGFRKIFRSSDIIISKGQGNFEALSEVKAPIYFLLQIKCDPVACYMGMEVGSLLFFRTSNG